MPALRRTCFAVVPDAFAFVRLRLADRAHFGGELADLLLVGAFDHDMRLVGAGDREALGNLLVHFVGEADAKLQRVALDRAQVTDALNLQLLLVAFA